MLLQFEEIAFEAEMNRHEDPEFEEQARILCNEDPATRAQKINELRNMVIERGECIPMRLDDAYLLRFLRARFSNCERAHRLLVRYTRFRDQNPGLWRGVEWFGLTRLGSIFEGVLFDRPDVGRLIIARLGLWDPSEFTAEQLSQGTLLLLEVGIMQPKLQVLGGTALIDCEGLTLAHLRHLTPQVVSQAISIMGHAFPVHQRGVHVVNCSRIAEALFQVTKRLAPAAAYQQLHFHHDLESLHRHVPPECLPPRYGGQRRPVALARWLERCRSYGDKEFHHEMRALGYTD